MESVLSLVVVVCFAVVTFSFSLVFLSWAPKLVLSLALYLARQGIGMVPAGRLFIVGCSDGDVFAFQAKVHNTPYAVPCTAALFQRKIPRFDSRDGNSFECFVPGL